MTFQSENIDKVDSDGLELTLAVAWRGGSARYVALMLDGLT